MAHHRQMLRGIYGVDYEGRNNLLFFPDIVCVRTTCLSSHSFPFLLSVLSGFLKHVILITPHIYYWVGEKYVQLFLYHLMTHPTSALYLHPQAP